VKAGLDGSIENFVGNETITYNQNAAGVAGIPVSDVHRQFGAARSADRCLRRRQMDADAVRFRERRPALRSLDRLRSGSQLSPRIEINGQVDPQDILHFYYGRLYAAPFLEDTRRAAAVLGRRDEPAPLCPCSRSAISTTSSASSTRSRRPRGPRSTSGSATSPTCSTRSSSSTRRSSPSSTTRSASPRASKVASTRAFANGDSLFFSATLSQSLAGGVSGSTFLFCPTLDPTCISSQSSLTLSPEDHDQTLRLTELGYSKRLGSDRSFFATIEPQYGTGYPVQFQNGSGRLPPHLTLDASAGREAKRGPKPRLGFDATFTNFTNTKYLLKINNGFNTTQWGPGFRADLRVTAPF
jgi:hypothetical protein